MFKEKLKEKSAKIEEAIFSYLPVKVKESGILFDAMEYSIKNGGKRLRPILMKEAYNLCGKEDDAVLPFAAAIEMIHTYSLIHDDLPSLDDDDLRRGKPTNHKVFGEAMAILAGDGLLTYAFELASNTKSYFPNTDIERILDSLKELANIAGVFGMVGGQVADIESENKDIGFSTLKFIHLNKTAKMIKGALKIGGIMAGANEKQLNALEDFGINIGLAFQITDDVLDVEGNEEDLGKPIGSDEKLNKATYPKFLNLEESKKEAKRLIEEAKSKLSIFKKSAEFLKELADFIYNRSS